MMCVCVMGHRLLDLPALAVGRAARGRHPAAYLPLHLRRLLHHLTAGSNPLSTNRRRDALLFGPLVD